MGTAVARGTAVVVMAFMVMATVVSAVGLPMNIINRE